MNSQSALVRPAGIAGLVTTSLLPAVITCSYRLIKLLDT